MYGFGQKFLNFWKDVSWIPLVKQLLLSQKSSKIKKFIFLRILFEKKVFDERNPTV
jgi:hypothetical protein